MMHNMSAWQAALPAFLLALSVQAHDPSKHAAGNEKADCTKVKHMDQSEADMDDPVMQAMMQKCKDEIHQGEAGTEDNSGDRHPEPDANHEGNNRSGHKH